ncbi:MAG TPA: S8 family serine peptidase [Mycobacteriales bacterium]|nr:S8 family serine peptidase [Mycobacteriales bacterium]
MTAPRSPSSAVLAGCADVGRRRAVVLALALAASTAFAPSGALAPASATQPPVAELSRVVVSAVGGGAAGVAAAADAVVEVGGRVLDPLPLVGGVSAELPAGAVLAPGLVVAPDRPVEVASSSPYADGPVSTVRGTLGLGAPTGEGAGVTVAVVDTGVAPSADLAGRLTSVDVTGTGLGDGYGHGTFVAGLVAGSGAASGGRYAGVAPGARVLSVRVADDDGRTNLVTVLRGLEAAAARGADVVNLSLSSYSPLPYQIDPLTVALASMWDRGTVVVVPAGNDGPDGATITSPGVHPRLLTVGALDEGGTTTRTDDVVADFSARGPAPQGVAKPELTAPGRSVVSLRAPGSVIDTAHGATAAVGADYFQGSGTSFATAVTAGAAAALLAERRLTPDQVKALLVTTSYAADGLADPVAAGAGGLDLATARTAAAPDLGDASTSPGRKHGHDKREAAAAGAGAEWQPLVRAMRRGSADAAASSWSRLSPEAKAWAASSWSSLPADLRAELVAEWTGRNWAHLSPETWAAIDWAGRNWAAGSWSGRNWAGRNWAGRNWADTEDEWLVDWDGRNWAGRNWAGRNWAAGSWSGRNWAGRNWAASSWSAGSWSAFFPS